MRRNLACAAAVRGIPGARQVPEFRDLGAARSSVPIDPRIPLIFPGAWNPDSVDDPR
jgi:hypothetical protein